MPEGLWKLLRKLPESLPGSRFMPSQTFVLAHQPMRQVVIQVLPHGGHRRLVESAVILMPATKYRVEHGRQVSQTLVTFQLKMPTAYRLSHCLEGVAADCGCKIHIDPTILVDCFTRTEGIAKKRELDTLAFDQRRLWWFATRSCKPIARGHTLISYAACCGPLISVLHTWLG